MPLGTTRVALLAGVGCISALVVFATSTEPARSKANSKAPASVPLSFVDPEVKLGERLFFETRLSKFFFEKCRDDANCSVEIGDPVVDEVTLSRGTSLDGPFRGRAINCRQCHLGDEFIDQHPLKGRTYCDFNRRSRIPQPVHGRTTTVRNTPIMPDLGLSRDVPTLFHFDGEYVTAEDLIVDTLVGSDFGWSPVERYFATRHIAKIIRDDDGKYPRAVHDGYGRGIPYRIALRGASSSLPENLRIPPSLRIDVESASDEEIVNALARLIHAYIDSLRFGTDHTFRTSLSPYDLFLRRNTLPTRPEPGETAQAYSGRLFRRIKQQKSPAWITAADGQFQLHAQEYRFGSRELRGLNLFFRKGSRVQSGGNCVACHIAPLFTDGRFHNTGASQVEYDSVFGLGAFAALSVPSLADRNLDFDGYLPPSRHHPNATGRFREIPSQERPGFADLGVWNVVGNPDLPKPQAALMEILCTEFRANAGCIPQQILPMTIAYFKTPSIRDLGQSDPYLHAGTLSSIDDVVRFYYHVCVNCTIGDNIEPDKLKETSKVIAGFFNAVRTSGLGR